MLDKKRSKGTVKLGTNNTGMVMSHKQGEFFQAYNYRSSFKFFNILRLNFF